MINPCLGFVLLFVNSPVDSSSFYQKMLGLKPVQESETFALFKLENVMLGLWSNKTAEPKVTAAPGATEISFEVENVDATYAWWVSQGFGILQEPTDMDFGRTFVGLDPDGHRIRIYKLKG